MKYVSIVAILFSANLFARVCVAVPQEATPSSDQTEQATEMAVQIADLVERAQGTLGFSGVVLAAKNGEIVATCSAGFADLENEQPIDADTLFEIASTTKLFTALAICRLAEQGRLDLDDPIAKHLPGIPKNCSEITIRHLLQHTSGIPGTNSNGGGDDLETVLPVFLAGGPLHEPGTRREYWNQGYALLSEIVAQTSGKSYMDYCRESIFEPAGMSHTGFTGDPPPSDVLVATGQSERFGPPRTALEHPYGSYGFQYRGMGGIVTNVNDLWRWDRAMARNEIVSKETLSEMLQPGLDDYGLGMYITRNEQDQVFHGHDGTVRGFNCFLRRYPESDGCLFVLGNRDNGVGDVVRQCVEILLFGGDQTQLIPSRLTDEQFDKFAGTYFSESIDMQLEINREGDLITGRLSSISKPDERHTPVYVGTNSDGEYVVMAGHVYSLPIVESADGNISGLRLFNVDFTRR